MTEEQTQAFQKVMMDCYSKEKATKDDLDEYFAQKSPTSSTAKCMRACMAETFGAVRVALENKSNDYSTLLTTPFLF